jgi:hypothetical protein
MPTPVPPLPLMAFMPAPPTSTVAGMQASLAVLEAESWADCLAYAKRVQGDKSTVKMYSRHVRSYEKWWEGYQAQKMDTIPHSCVGKESISQTISALENWRVHHAHLYEDDRYAQVSLCDDNWIKTMEMAMKHDEPK